MPSSSSAEEQDVKVQKRDPDYPPPGVQSVSESWQEKQEVDALGVAADLMQQVRRMHKVVSQALGRA